MASTMCSMKNAQAPRALIVRISSEVLALSAVA